MLHELQHVVIEAKSWLQSQPTTETQSPAWYALANIQRFASELEASNSTVEIEKAIWELSRFQSDQYDIPTEYNKIISACLQEAQRVVKRR